MGGLIVEKVNVTIPYTLGRGLGRLCFSIFGRFEVEGREAVPPRGRLLVVANHLSNADPPVVAAAMPRRVWFLAHKGLFKNPLLALAFKAWGVHAVSRGGNDPAAARWALNVLEQEGVVGLFPEATRSPEGLRKPLYGVAYLASKTQSPILPIGITGTERVPGYWRILFPFHKIRARIGSPFTLPVIEGKPSREVLESLTDMIMMRIAELLPDEYRGVYRNAFSSTTT